MIDNIAIFLFGVLIAYTTFRAIQLDSIRPWFTDKDEPNSPPPKKKKR